MLLRTRRSRPPAEDSVNGSESGIGGGLELRGVGKCELDEDFGSGVARKVLADDGMSMKGVRCRSRSARQQSAGKGHVTFVAHTVSGIYSRQRGARRRRVRDVL